MARKQKEPLEEAVENITDTDQHEPQVYELGFHIDPELSQNDVKQLYQTLKSAIAEVSTVIATGEPEKMQLAYTIYRMEHEGRHDFSSSFFAWIAYEATVDNHTAILKTAREESRIFRFIDILTNKEAVEHAVEQRDLRMRAQEKPEDAQEVSEAELDAALEQTAA